MENFINHKDPTLPIDTSFIEIRDAYEKLSKDEKIMVTCRLLGMNHVPTDFKTFLFDDYFLGQETGCGSRIFKYWLDKFPEIFPNQITTKTPYISFTGCIGSGKSFISKMIGLYMYHRLDCCSDVYASLGLAKSSKIAFGFFHASADTAERDFVRSYKDVFESSPYFKNLYNNPPIRLIASGPQSTGSVIGTQLVFSVLSEVGFWKPGDAISKIGEVLIRYESRFKDKRHHFGMVIADSSAKDSDHGATQEFEDRVPADELFRISPAHWEVRPELYTESKGNTFDFFIGDSKQLPRMIEPGEDLIKANIDLDRVIHVPDDKQTRLRFQSDPIRSLQDLAGIPYSGNSLFFGGDLSHLLKCSSIRNYAPEEIIVDFYDKTDSIYSKVETMLYRVPKHTNLFVHFDIGLVKDKTGVSLCYYNGEQVDPSGGKATYPKFKVPLCFVVSRKKGQATSLDHLYQFLKDLISNGYYVTLSADSFSSAGIFQSCERDGIEYKAISIDKTMDAGVAFKNIVNTERIELPYNNILLRECSEIRVVTNGKNNEHIKLDHPLTSSCTEFDYTGRSEKNLPGTKDLFDAVCGSVFSCLRKYGEYMENGVTGGFVKSVKALGTITQSAREQTQKQFQHMIENIF